MSKAIFLNDMATKPDFNGERYVRLHYIRDGRVFFLCSSRADTFRADIDDMRMHGYQVPGWTYDDAAPEPGVKVTRLEELEREITAAWRKRGMGDDDECESIVLLRGLINEAKGEK